MRWWPSRAARIRRRSSLAPRPATRGGQPLVGRGRAANQPRAPASPFSPQGPTPRRSTMVRAAALAVCLLALAASAAADCTDGGAWREQGCVAWVLGASGAGQGVKAAPSARRANGVQHAPQSSFPRRPAPSRPSLHCSTPSLLCRHRAPGVCWPVGLHLYPRYRCARQPGHHGRLQPHRRRRQDLPQVPHLLQHHLQRRLRCEPWADRTPHCLAFRFACLLPPCLGRTRAAAACPRDPATASC